MQEKQLQATSREDAETVAAMLRCYLVKFKPFEDSERTLQPDEVVEVCARHLNTHPDNLKGGRKVKHKDDQDTMLAFALLYCNFPEKLLLDKLKFRPNVNLRLHALAWDLLPDRKMYEPTLNILSELEYKSDYRLYNNLKLSLTTGTEIGITCSNGASDMGLDKYQIEKIPRHTLEWFINNKGRSLAAYHQNAKDNSVWYILSTTGYTAQFLYDAQYGFGFRFINYNYESWSKIRKHHPVCDKCIHSGNCNLREVYAITHNHPKAKNNFDCYESPHDQDGIDGRLLAMPYFIPQ